MKNFKLIMKIALVTLMVVAPIATFITFYPVGLLLALGASATNGMIAVNVIKSVIG